MALAAVLHHSYDKVHTEYGAPRSQNTATRARGGGESDEKKYTAKFRKTPPPQAFFQLYEEEDAVWGVRPGSVFDPVPQGRVERQVVEHRIEECPFVQILDAPVPQLGNQVLELLQKIVTASFVEPVQVIEVPKIFPDSVPQRLVERRPPQTAEQLVEVPTILSYSSLQRAVEQTIDIPVPQARRGGGGGLQGFRAGQGTPAADVEQIVEIPVPQRRRRRSGGLQSSLPGQGSTSYLEQIVDIPARGGLQGFLPGQGSSSSSRLHGGTDEGIQGVFRTFPREEKSAEQGPHSRSELGADFTPWTPAACDAPMVAESWSVEELEDLGIWVDEFGRWWSRSGVFPERWVMHDTSDGPTTVAKVEVDVPVVLVVDVGAVQLLDKVTVSWRQNRKEGGLTLSGGVGAHHTGDELN